MKAQPSGGHCVPGGSGVPILLGGFCRVFLSGVFVRCFCWVFLLLAKSVHGHLFPTCFHCKVPCSRHHSAISALQVERAADLLFAEVSQMVTTRQDPPRPGQYFLEFSN